MDDVEDTEGAYFTVSENGWSDNSVGLPWLIHVFHPETKARSRNRRRLLIMDGHSSHLNLKFINKCDELGIILLVFPPHTTQRLQPLDVGCFLPLAIFYSQGIQALMKESEGIVSLQKKDFWRIFYEAWLLAMTEENILKAFTKSGIWPIKSSVVMDILEPQRPLPTSEQLRELAEGLKTPMNRHQHR